MTIPLNSLAMFLAMCCWFLLAFVVWTAGSGWFSFPSLIQDAVGWACVGGGFVFLALFVAALFDDMKAQETE